MIEKRGTTNVNDIRELVKQANDEEQVVVINLPGLLKFASGRYKDAVVVVATGDRATAIREMIDKASP